MNGSMEYCILYATERDSESRNDTQQNMSRAEYITWNMGRISFLSRY
jgi:hypothetical protein